MITLKTFSLPKRILIFFIWLFMLVLAKTLRVKNNDDSNLFTSGSLFKENQSKSSIILFWHNQLLLIFLIFINYKKRFPPITILVSSNKSADIFAAILEKFGYSVIRGSANNKSLQALKGLHKAIRNGHIIAYAADGPTGPIYKFKPGAVFLSIKYELPIDLIHIHPSRAIAFKTWDKLMLPFPFAKLQFYWSRVLHSQLNETNDKLEKEKLLESISELQKRMGNLTGDFNSN